LTTQLHWRLNEGKGEAFYEIGVRDNGEAVGIPLASMVKSVRTLARMCQVLNAELEIVRFRGGREPTLRAVRVRVTRIVDKKVQQQQIRVSAIGDFESGKSTLVGVLTRGCLDDGCGLARMQVVRHRHEIENGCTSSISEHTIGITHNGRVCLTDVMEDGELRDDDESDGEPADIKSVITFSDLAGHKKYFKVTASGLASQFPDYAMLVVDSAKGVEAMATEHIKIAMAFDVAVFVVLTKVDLVTADRIAQTVREVTERLQAIAPTKKIRCCIDGHSADDVADADGVHVIPVLAVSSVTGFGLATLRSYLAALSPTRVWSSANATAPEFQINKAYSMDDTGTIVTGLVQSGTIRVGETLLLGPNSDGAFSEVSVDSIEVQRKAVPSLSAGETGALLISSSMENQEDDEVAIPASRIRKGMVLIHPSVSPMATLQFDAEVHLLHEDERALKANSQAVIHAGRVRQMAKVVSVETLGKQDSPRAICRFEFMYWPEYVRPDIPIVLREECTYAAGKVVRAVHLTTAEQAPSVRTF
jgi:GTPase